MIKDIENVLAQVITITKEAGAKVLEFYGGELDIKTKDNDSPVTKADLASNEVLIRGLKQFGYPILSEEGGDESDRSNADLVWIIDPLDGTKDFIQMTGEFTIMVALVERQADGTYRPILGLIYRPVADLIYCATLGGGAWAVHDKREPRKLRVSSEKSWHNAVLLTSRNHSSEIERQITIELGIAKVISYGSSLKACLIAEEEGHINFNPAPYTWEWDVCASDIIISEAGGRFTDTRGELFTYNKKDPRNTYGYVATNGVFHDEIIANIKKL